MPRLSNFFRSRDLSADSPMVHRPVQKQEIESALRLILLNDDGLATDAAVLDFLTFAVTRKIDLDQIWVTQVGNRIAWALLPITSPGRTMLLFSPSRLPRATPTQAVPQLAEAICRYWQHRQMHLAQFLLDPADRAVQELYVASGFEVLAELIYLHRLVRADPGAVDLPPGFEILTYTPATHPRFAQAIQLSYEGSLDCPALNGKRSIDDVIEGHKSAGGFDPAMWHLLLEHGEPRGVLILSPSQHNLSVELVYLGLAPQARRRGLGDLMMRLAIARVAREHRNELSLAVDSRNEPAMRLYYRHGLKRIGSRIALVRDLRNTTPTASQATL